MHISKHKIKYYVNVLYREKMINTIDNQIDTLCFLKEGMTIQYHLANKSEKKNVKTFYPFIIL